MVPPVDDPCETRPAIMDANQTFNSHHTQPPTIPSEATYLAGDGDVDRGVLR